MAKLVGFIKISSLSSHFYNELHEYGQTPNNNASAFADALYHISAEAKIYHTAHAVYHIAHAIYRLSPHPSIAIV